MTVTNVTDRSMFRQTLRAWVSNATGIAANKIIWANQSTVRPAKPYATMFFPSGFVKPGAFDESDAEYKSFENVIQRTTHGPRINTLQVDIYTEQAATANANEAYELMENLLNALDTIAVRDAFRAAKIGVLGQSDIRRMDEQLGDRWERRANADISLSYSQETFDDGGGGTGNYIATVEVPSEEEGTANYGQSNEDET